MATKRTGSVPSAWAYLVVSSDAQALTLGDQEAWATRTAAEKKWRVTRTFRGVTSGKDGPRRLLRELIAAARDLAPEQRPAWVMMIRSDRVGRGRIAESMVALHELIDLGIRIWTRDDGEVRLDSAMEQLISAAKSAVASYENSVRADKAVNVYKRKRAAGLAIGNRRPYGLSIGPDGRDVLLETHAQAIREAFALRIAGNGYYVIASRLREIAPAQHFKNGREQLVRWTPERVSRMLSNKAYADAGVIDAATFLRTQRIREQVATNRDSDSRTRHPWPLGGALRCYCGRAMTGLISGPKQRRRRYYACRHPDAHDGKVRLVSADQLEHQFAELLQQLRAEPHQFAEFRRRAITSRSPAAIDGALREARARLADAERRRRKVWDLFEQGRVREDDVQSRLDEITSARSEAEALIPGLEEEKVLLEHAARRDKDAEALLAQASTKFRRAKPDAQRAFARTVSVTLGGLHVSKDGAIEVGEREDPKRQRGRSAGGK